MSTADAAKTEVQPDYVLVERVAVNDHGQVAAIVRLNRPEQLNAISWTVQTALGGVLQELANDVDVCAVFITGEGRAFSAGGDIKAYAELQADGPAFTRFLDEYCELIANIGRMRKPVIALVNGVCAAGGTELLLGCDFAWAASSARIGDMHINFAQIGGAGALTRLPRLVGPSRALELMLSGKLITAEEARAWGLVNRVLPDDELLTAAIEFARALASKSPTAGSYIKKTIWATLATDTASALKLERDSALEYCLTNPDSMEGIHAFIEKRAPNFRNLT